MLQTKKIYKRIHSTFSVITMKKMKVKGQKWLKGIHIFFACIWIGAGFCLILMQMGLKADSGGTLHGIDVSMKFLDLINYMPG